MRRSPTLIISWGELLGELKRKGLYENTVIVVTSDHGEHLGDHRLFAKSSFLESSARVPIILRLPNARGIANRRVDAPVLTADIAPTLLELAGLAPDKEMDGISLLQQPDGRVVFGESTDSVFATDGCFKYIWYFDGGREQLFDVIADPDDCRNLANHSGICRSTGRLESTVDQLFGASQAASRRRWRPAQLRE